MNYTPETYNLDTNGYHNSGVKWHTIKSDSMQELKEQLKAFAAKNCYHIIGHTLDQSNGLFTLQIEYI